jgi:hypothetical protein
MHYQTLEDAVAQSEDSELKAELEAISSMVATLEPLSAATRANVIDYVFRRLGITLPSAHGGHSAASPVERLPQPGAAFSNPGEAGGRAHTKLSGGTVVDLLTLKEEKQPANTNEMVALVAYYLAHEAPATERREQITAEDVTRCFREARFPLPAAPFIPSRGAKR